MTIPKPIYEELISHARAEAPNECCGLIGGQKGKAKTVYRARNAEASPLRYNLDPQDQFRIMSEMDERGEDLSAIYHSQPPAPRTRRRPTSTRGVSRHPHRSSLAEGERASRLQIKDGEVTRSTCRRATAAA
jgi:hypothetical protein